MTDKETLHPGYYWVRFHEALAPVILELDEYRMWFQCGREESVSTYSFKVIEEVSPPSNGIRN